MRLLFLLPPAKFSHEIDTFRSMEGVEVIAVGARGEPEADVEVPVLRAPVLGSEERWTAALAVLRRLASVDPGAVDAVVSQELFSATSAQATRLAANLNVPHVVLVAEILTANPLYRLPPWRWFTRRVARSVEGIVCDTEVARDHVVEGGWVPPDRLHVVSPGVDTQTFRPAPKGPPKDNVVTFVGELRPDKGVLDLVAACDPLSRELDAFRLVLVGDGPLRRELEQSSVDKPYVEVKGRLPREDLVDVLWGTRAFALTSYSRRFWSEQYGFAAVEAMSCGLPVVATRCGALLEVVPSHNPLADERDTTAIAGGLRRALGSEGEEWGRRNRDYVLDRLDLTQQARRLRRVLDDVVQRARGSSR